MGQSRSAYKFVFDESAHGDRNRGDFYALAGVYASTLQWGILRKQWRTALRSGRRIRYFKMSEATRRAGEFDAARGWTAKLVKDKVELLTDVLRAHAGGHIVILVPMVLFRNAMRTSHIPLEYEDPYLFCFFKSLDAVAYKMENLPEGQIKPRVVFDQQSNFNIRCCCEIWDELRHARRRTPKAYRIGKWLRRRPSFQEDKKQEIGIQMADLVAWHYRTLPWERQFKRNRRRSFLGKIGGLECIGPNVQSQHLLAWRRAIELHVKSHT